MSVRAPFDDAYQSYVKALSEATAHQHIQQRATEAYTVYSQVLQEMSAAEPYKRAQDAYENYVRVLQGALESDDVQVRADQAYSDYVRALKDAWSKADDDLLDVPSLAAIGQSMVSVAWTASTATSSNHDSSALEIANDVREPAEKS
jgi:hypothetical protein